MTVANENMEWSITCDGATESATGVVLDAYLYDDDDIEVILKTIATGAETTLTKTTDYTVSGVPGATAAVKTTSNYTSASAIYVRRVATLTQTNDLVTGDSIPSEVIEQILDKEVMTSQVVNNNTDRGIQVTKASGLTGLTVIPTASKIIGFNAAGDDIMLYDTSTDSGSAALADLLSSSGFGTIIYPQEVQVGSTGIRVISGTGSPEGVVTANVSSVYLRTNGGVRTAIYVKQSGAGNTGWVVINAAHDHSDAANGGYANGVVQMVSTQDGAVDTGTTAMPNDDTIPQITEGDEYMTLAITPKDATNKLVIETSVVLSCDNDETMGIALFQDATAAALAVNQNLLGFASKAYTLTLRHVMAAGTTSATTFRIRCGAEGGTVTFNGVGAGRKMGGIMASNIVITEIKQ